MRHWMKYFLKTWNLIWYFITHKTNLVSRLAIISLTSLILFMLSLTLLIIVLLPRAVLVGVIFRTFAMFIPCGLFRKLSISSSAFSAPSDDWNLSMGCNAKRSTPVLHHLLTYKKKHECYIVNVVQKNYFRKHWCQFTTFGYISSLVTPIKQ